MGFLRSKKRIQQLKRAAIVAAVAVIVLPALAVGWIHQFARGRVYSDISNVPECRVALVLGSMVLPNGDLYGITKDRVDTAIRLYDAGKVEKLLMSGDNRFSHYNEPQRMADYAVAQGVSPRDVAMDFAGRRTYDSVYRAKHIFDIDRMIVVSQRFHLDRALFLADALGIDAYGVSGEWTGDLKCRVREVPAILGAIFDAYIRHPLPIMGGKEEI